MDQGLVDCAVVGGGPSGLVLAALLARSGWRVTVLEEGEVGQVPALAISPFLAPPSLRLFADLGLLDELVRIGQPVREVVETSVDGGRFVLDYAERAGTEFGYALSVPLWKLTGVLRDSLAAGGSVEVLSKTSVRGIEDSGDVITLDLEGPEGSRTLRSRFLVCADGKFSKVRELAGIAAEVFEFDRPLVMMVLPAPDGWPDRLALHHAERDSLVAVMPFAGGGMAVQWLGHPDELALLRSAGVAELRSRVTRVVPELTDLLAATVTEWDQVLMVRHHVVRPEVWSRGRAALLGDCAHGVHSLGGQGLNLGIQDAMVLGSLLAGAGVDTDPTPFAEYERVRRPFVEEFQRYQMTVPQLSAQPEGGAGSGAIYEVIAEQITDGQPGVLERYRRLVLR